MKQFNWRTFENLELNPRIGYINSCCEFCDLILEKVKVGIGEKMAVNSDEIIIGQEDWGWFLEFQKDKFFYILSLSYLERDKENAHHFTGIFVVINKQNPKRFRHSFTSQIEFRCKQTTNCCLLEYIFNVIGLRIQLFYYKDSLFV
jgi:hypothetical protein